MIQDMKDTYGATTSAICYSSASNALNFTTIWEHNVIQCNVSQKEYDAMQWGAKGLLLSSTAVAQEKQTNIKQCFIFFLRITSDSSGGPILYLCEAGITLGHNSVDGRSNLRI